MAGEEQRALFTLACLAQRAKKYGVARAAWEKYISFRASDPKAHFNLGVCLDSLGKGGAALVSFEKAFELQPRMADAGANAAGLLIRAGEAERACTLCYLALKGNPDCSAALYNLNTALRMAGRHDEAVTFSWRWIRDCYGRRKSPSNPATSASLPFPSVAEAVATGASSTGLTETGDGVAGAPVPPIPAPALTSTPTQPFPPTEQTDEQPEGVRSADSLGGVSLGERAIHGGAGSRGGDGSSGGEYACGAGPLTVACVKWGDKYGPEYVERLAAGVRRNLRRDHQFVCFTDDTEALRGMAGVMARPLGTGRDDWQGWWHKAFLFSREAGLAGRVLYLDLDTIVIGSLDDISGYSGSFAALSVQGMVNERRPLGLNSSLMSWDADREGANLSLAVDGMLKDAYEVITTCVHKLDHWLEMTVPGAKTLQHLFPGQIVEYNSTQSASALEEGGAVKAVKDQKLLFQGARVLCFPLEPKPHQVKEDWLQRQWRGGEGIGSGVEGEAATGL